jgi:formate/nitrite transporter FocA (FNT family)
MKMKINLKSITKKIFIVVAFVFAILGIDHFTYNFAGIGASVTVTDSTIVVAPTPDTTTIADTTTRAIAPIDTAKK